MGSGAEFDSGHADNPCRQFFRFEGLLKDVIGTEQSCTVEFDILHGRNHQDLGAVQIGSKAHVLDHVEATEPCMRRSRVMTQGRCSRSSEPAENPSGAT